MSVSSSGNDSRQEEASSIMGQAVEETSANVNTTGENIELQTDGIGTKVEVAERTGDHSTMGYNLVAMTAGDLVALGGKPIYLTDDLSVNTLSGGDKIDEAEIDEILHQLAHGLIEAANKAGIAVTDGEVAELGNRVNGYGPFNYNWSGTIGGLIDEERRLDGSDIEPGDCIVALPEHGFRSNGFTLVRNTLEAEFGQEWHTEEWNGETLGEQVIEPSTIYTQAICDMTGGYDGYPAAAIANVVHVTGGGIPEMLGRALQPQRLGAKIYEPYAFPDIMEDLQEIGGIEDNTAYKEWNGGHAYLIITPEPDAVISTAEEHGHDAKVAGQVKAPGATDPTIRIENMGVHENGPDTLTYAL